MGGIGSGARRSTHIGNVEEMLALDIRALRRLGVVATGECIIDTVHWSTGGLRIASARLRVDLSEIERGGCMTIIGEMANDAIKQHVTIAMVPSQFGGHRCYFICPFSARRCEVLYYAGGRFASRHAHRLSYASQSMNDLSRARRKVAKLCSRLKGLAGFRRPRGRKRIKTAMRLDDAERAAVRIYFDRLSRWC